MKILISLLLVAATFYACSNNPTNAAEENTTTAEQATENEQPVKASLSEQPKQRYGIKSARVVTETQLPMDMGVSISTLYFDDYGALSFTEAVTKLKMKLPQAPPKDYHLTKGDYTYSWKEGEKTGTKMNPEKMQDLNHTDIENLTEEMIKEMNIKKGGTETFFGKTCQVTEMDSETMGTGKILTWKNIILLSDMTMMGMKIKSEVKELDENASIDRGKFELPAGVEFKEMDFNFEDEGN
jgi:hypothetical protein